MQYVFARRPYPPAATFTTATAIVPERSGAGLRVKVGTIKSIEPAGTQAKMILKVDHGVSTPADAKAVIVTGIWWLPVASNSLPAYRSSGPVMADGAVIRYNARPCP